MKVITPASKLVFKYLALPNGLGGRGGAQRFFLLSQNIPFEERLFGRSDGSWQTEKQRLIQTNENPFGTVPIIYAESEDPTPTTTNTGETTDNDIYSNYIPLPQHIATARFLAHVYGLENTDPYHYKML
jgi:hypothetical protein